MLIARSMDVMSSALNQERNSPVFFVVAAHRNGNIHLKSHHPDKISAEKALKMRVDMDRLSIERTSIEFSSNGNVRIWRMLPN